MNVMSLTSAPSLFDAQSSRKFQLSKGIFCGVYLISGNICHIFTHKTIKALFNSNSYNVQTPHHDNRTCHPNSDFAKKNLCQQQDSNPQSSDSRLYARALAFVNKVGCLHRLVHLSNNHKLYFSIPKYDWMSSPIYRVNPLSF